MKDLYCNHEKWGGDGDDDRIMVGISSRTDEPTWARELLQKFEIETDDGDGNTFALQDAFESGPIEIAKDSK
eukprot:3144645-Ditylum_brightwellii.AAC.1